LDNKSGAANCALIFWTTEAVESSAVVIAAATATPKAFVEDNVRRAEAQALSVHF
jgi:hypothetical protein